MHGLLYMSRRTYSVRFVLSREISGLPTGAGWYESTRVHVYPRSRSISSLARGNCWAGAGPPPHPRTRSYYRIMMHPYIHACAIFQVPFFAQQQTVAGSGGAKAGSELRPAPHALRVSAFADLYNRSLVLCIDPLLCGSPPPPLPPLPRYLEPSATVRAAAVIEYRCAAPPLGDTDTASGGPGPGSESGPQAGPEDDDASPSSADSSSSSSEGGGGGGGGPRSLGVAVLRPAAWAAAWPAAGGAPRSGPHEGLLLDRALARGLTEVTGLPCVLSDPTGGGRGTSDSAAAPEEAGAAAPAGPTLTGGGSGGPPGGPPGGPSGGPSTSSPWTPLYPPRPEAATPPGAVSAPAGLPVPQLPPPPPPAAALKHCGGCGRSHWLVTEDTPAAPPPALWRQLMAFDDDRESRPAGGEVAARGARGPEGGEEEEGLSESGLEQAGDGPWRPVAGVWAPTSIATLLEKVGASVPLSLHLACMHAHIYAGCP